METKTQLLKIQITMFKDLEKLIPENTTLAITITVLPGNKMSILTAWKGKDEYSEVNNIPSIVMTGTVDEIEQEFLKTVIQPLKKSAGIVTNLAFYEKELEMVKKKSAEKLANAIKAESKKKPAKNTVASDNDDDDIEDDPIPGNKQSVKNEPIDLFSAAENTEATTTCTPMPNPDEMPSDEEEIIPEPTPEKDPWDTGISSGNAEPVIDPDGKIL
jgi:PRTRC genetic system protein E